jgi:hypothetical protein
LEIPHAAAGPLVTPTNPIFNVGFAAHTDADINKVVEATIAMRLNMFCANISFLLVDFYFDSKMYFRIRRQ